MPTTAGLEDRLRRVASRQNVRVKQLRRAFAEAAPNPQGEIAIEGMHLLEEAMRSGLRLTTVFFSESARERAHRLLPQLSAHTEALLLPDAVFASAVPTETPQGVAALAQVKSCPVSAKLSPTSSSHLSPKLSPKPFPSLEAILAAEPALLVITAGLQDPGNLGAIARSAEAFGATGLLLGAGTVSPWSWKALRASAGSLFRLPAVKVELATVLAPINARGVRLLATSSHKGTPLPAVDLRGPVAIIVGSEGAGVPKDVLSQADEILAIPQSSRVESLNAAIAASIVLYEAARQRNRR